MCSQHGLEGLLFPEGWGSQLSRDEVGDRGLLTLRGRNYLGEGRSGCGPFDQQALPTSLLQRRDLENTEMVPVSFLDLFFGVW